MDKTVVGCGYYMPTDERADYAQHVRTVFAGHLPEANVLCEGQILLGTPMGDDKMTRSSESFSGDAPVYIGPNDASDGSEDGPSYREQKVLAMIDAHDRRLRAVVDLSRRDGRSYTALVRLSVQLAHLLLQWSCNARDVHLLRGLPTRIIETAARRHRGKAPSSRTQIPPPYTAVYRAVGYACVR